MQEIFFGKMFRSISSVSLLPLASSSASISIGFIEMIFDGALVTARYENQFRYAGSNGFFNGVLDQWLINDRHHFLWDLPW